jgi:hypothetical protein
MFDGKFIVTLISLIISVVAICNFDKKEDSTEGFLGMSATAGLVPEASIKIDNKFVSIQSPQSMLSPRFDNTGYASTIRYNLPDNKNMGAPLNPLGYPSCVKENFSAPTNCGGGVGFNSAPLMSSDYMSGNRGQVVDQIIEDSGVSMDGSVSSMVPAGTLESIGPDGLSKNITVMNGLRVVNANSRLRSAGDMIRGDIVPCCATGSHIAWVPLSANPNLDLQQGAMFALGGMDNSVVRNTASLMNNATGSTTIAGMNMSSMDISSLSAGMNDITVSAFP